MSERPRILAELAAAQGEHVLDALDRGRAHVGTELLVAEDGQPLLEAQLEPVAAGDAVARPVVEILVRNDRLDAREILVCRRFGQGQDVLGVEDVQPLVLHCPHVEVVHRDDVEHVQIVFAPIGALVPGHRPDQAVHRIGAAPLVARPHPDRQVHRPARGGGEGAAMRHQIARHQREQVGGFRPGVVPFGPAGAGGHRVAVRQQHRKVGLDPHPERRHHIGPVGVEGDPAETLGLALGAVHAVRHVEPFQRSVGLGVDFDLGLEREGPGGQECSRNREPAAVRFQLQRPPVQRQPQQPRPLAVEPQVRPARAPRREADARGHPRPPRRQPEGHVHPRHGKGIGGVVGQMDRFAVVTQGVGHGALAFGLGSPQQITAPPAGATGTLPRPGGASPPGPPEDISGQDERCALSSWQKYPRGVNGRGPEGGGRPPCPALSRKAAGAPGSRSGRSCRRRSRPRCARAPYPPRPAPHPPATRPAAVRAAP